MSQVGIWRQQRMRAVHASCKSAGIDDSERKRLQMDVVGKASMADMSLDDLNRLLDHLNAASGYRGHAGKPAGVEKDPQLQKIEALLADMKLPWAYIHKSKSGPSMVRRLTGKDRIEWADAAGKTAVITALIVRRNKVAG